MNSVADSAVTSLRYLGAGFARIVLLPLWWVSGLVPRRADLWIFGSWGGQRYADNAAAFFEYCQRHVDGHVDLVWISHRPAIVRQLRSEGARAHWFWSPRGIACCLRAGFNIFDCFAKDTNFWLTRGARQVNLWSGVPLKRFERDIDNPRNRYYRLFHGSWPERMLLGALMPWHAKRPDFVIATSDETQDIVVRAFGLDDEQVVVTGNPRNDRLLSRPDAALPAAVPARMRTAVADGDRLMVYLPTFRDSGQSFMDFDWPRLDAALGAAGWRLLIKFHPVDKSEIHGDFQNIDTLPRDVEIYDLLPQTDALISDYSSVIWDYMLLKRPIIYYVPDLEEFTANCRGMLFDLHDIAVGPVCGDFAALLEAIQRLGDPHDESLHDTEHCSPVMQRLHRHRDAHACRRVLEELARRFPETRHAIAGDSPQLERTT